MFARTLFITLASLVLCTPVALAQTATKGVADDSTMAALTMTPTKPLMDGMAFEKQGKLKEALQQFQAAYQKNDQPDVASFLMADCYARMGDVARCKQYLEFVVKNWPSSQAATSAQPMLKAIKVATSAPELAKTWVQYQRADGGHMIVNGVINGQPIPMIFDTGAGACFATTSALRKYGIQVQTKVHGVRASGVGGELPVDAAVVTMQVGSLARQITLFVQDDEVQARTQGAASVLGMPLIGQNFFGDLAIEIDGGRNLLAFQTAADKVPPGVDNVSFRRVGNHIVVLPKINGRECEMILDTGAGAVSFTDAQFSGFGFSRPTNAMQGMSGGIGGMRHAYSFYLDSVELGPVKRKGVRAFLEMNGTMPYPLLGASFWDDAHYCIEPKLKRLLFY